MAAPDGSNKLSYGVGPYRYEVGQQLVVTAVDRDLRKITVGPRPSGSHVLAGETEIRPGPHPDGWSQPEGPSGGS